MKLTFYFASQIYLVGEKNVIAKQKQAVMSVAEPIASNILCIMNV